MPKAIVRPEASGDEAAVRRLIETAFRNAEHKSGTEARIVDGLRSAALLSLSLVALEDGAILGHVAFSQSRSMGADWAGSGSAP